MADVTPHSMLSGPMPTVEKEAQEYRPVSGWAVASMLVAAAYIVIVVFGGGIALYSWSPFLLPLWTLLLPVLGCTLALWAQYQIRQAEGTRAGGGLARASWWICLLLGVIYVSFFAATSMAVRFQADRSVQEWFELVRTNKLNEAFLRSVRPDLRVNVSPDDESMLRTRFGIASAGTGGQSPLSTFRSSQLVHLIQQGGSESRLKGLGVEEWQFVDGGYKVKRRYHLTTPEGELEVAITTASVESKMGQYTGRQWFLEWDNQALVRNAKLTPQGEKMVGLRLEGHKFLDDWRRKILSGATDNLEQAYLETQPIAERKDKAAAYKAGKLELKGILDQDSYRGDTEAWRKAAQGLLGTFFRPTIDDQPQVQHLVVHRTGSRRWEKVQDRLRFSYDGEMHFTAGKGTFYRAELNVVLESEPGAAEKGQSRDWRVVRIEFSQAQEPKLLPGQGPGQGP